MEELLIAVAYGGGIISIVGSLWLLVVMFQTSILWGLGGLFIPFVSFIFLVMHFDRAAGPFFVSVIGFVMSLIAEWIIGPENFEAAALTVRLLI